MQSAWVMTELIDRSRSNNFKSTSPAIPRLVHDIFQLVLRNAENLGDAQKTFQLIGRAPVK